MQANFGSANIKLITILLKISLLPDGATLIGPTVKCAPTCRPDTRRIRVELGGISNSATALASGVTPNRFAECDQAFARDGLVSYRPSNRF